MNRHQTDNGQAIPLEVDREITGDLVANVIDTAAGAAPGDSLEQRYKRAMIDLSDHLRNGSGDDGGDPPRAMLPGHPWLWRIGKALLVGTFIAGIAYGGMRMAVSRNEKAIEDHGDLPMHDAAAEQFSEIKTTVDSVKHDVGAVREEQEKISKGIEQLNKERVEELKEELRVERYRNRRRREAAD